MDENCPTDENCEDGWNCHGWNFAADEKSVQSSSLHSKITNPCATHNFFKNCPIQAPFVALGSFIRALQHYATHPQLFLTFSILKIRNLVAKLMTSLSSERDANHIGSHASCTPQGENQRVRAEIENVEPLLMTNHHLQASTHNLSKHTHKVWLDKDVKSRMIAGVNTHPQTLGGWNSSTGWK